MFHVLVADDDKNTRRLIQAVLEQNGYTVTTAVDGEDAMKKLEEASIDLLVLDIMMPTMDGYQFISRLRQESSVPVIMITAVSGCNSFKFRRRSIPFM